MNFIEKLAAEGHLTEEQVDRVGRNVAEFMDAVRRDPSLRKEAMEKLAFGLPTYLKNPAIRKGFMQKAVGHAWDVAPLAAGAAAIGGAFGLARKVGDVGVGAAKDKIQKARAYKNMVNENPSLQHVDPNVTQKAFNTLYRFNPEYAGDPMVAGTFVRNVADQERLDIGTVNSLVQARRNLADKGQAPDYMGMAQTMAKATGEQQKMRDAEEKSRASQAQGNVNFMAAQERLRAAEAAHKADKGRAEFWARANEPGAPDLQDDGSGEDPGA